MSSDDETDDENYYSSASNNIEGNNTNEDSDTDEEEDRDVDSDGDGDETDDEDASKQWDTWDTTDDNDNNNIYSGVDNENNNNNGPLNIDELITQLTSLVDYFRKIDVFKTDVVYQMQVTLQSLKQLHSYLQDKHKYRIELTSILSTLVVENFFSQIRSKVRYPNLYEFCFVMRRAMNEIIK